MDQVQSETLQDIRHALADVRASSGRGFASLFVFGTTVLVSGVIALYASPRVAALALMLLGGPAVAVIGPLERMLDYPPLAPENPLRPLITQLSLGKLTMFLATVAMFLVKPELVAVVFVAIVGGYYLPFAWMYGTRVYVVLAVGVGGLPWVMLLLGGAKTYPYILLAWAACDYAGAFLIRRGSITQ